MVGAGGAIQLIIPEGLIPSSIRETHPVADGVIEVVGLAGQAADGRQLMQDIRHLAGGIISRHRMV